jgi:N-dimethylarginine dimethylaminohydrolase
VGALESVLLKRPEDAFGSQDSIDAQWRDLHYGGPPGYDRARAEYARFTERIQQFADEVHFLPKTQGVGLDSLYVRDAAVITPRGAVLCRMGKAARHGEPEATGAFLKRLGYPILGAIAAPGMLEGGDVIWFDAQTVAVGRGYRTNAEGIRQFRELTRAFVRDVVVVPLPHWSGPADVMHLMSLYSPIDHNLALVYSALLPVPFHEWLTSRDVKLIEVPETEFATMACNVLALAPRRCLMLSGNPTTRRRLEAVGVEVFEYNGDEISRKGAGGPTCLTRPLRRRGQNGLNEVSEG